MNEIFEQFLAFDWTAKLKEEIKERQEQTDNDFEIIYVAATDDYEHLYVTGTIVEDENNLTLQDLVCLYGDPAIGSMVNTLFGCCGQVAFKGGEPYVSVKRIPHDEGFAYAFEFEAHIPDKERLARQLEIFLAG